MKQGDRMPFIQIQNKNGNLQNNNSKQKSIQLDQNTKNDNNQMVIDEGKYANINSIKTQSDDKIADEEYQKCVLKALKTAIDENEELRDKINQLIQENKQLKDEIDGKDSALLELAHFYEFCKKNHVEKDKSKTKKRKSLSL